FGGRRAVRPTCLRAKEDTSGLRPDARQTPEVSMFTRRQFLTRALRGSSLVALGSVVPQFVARTAKAAQPGQDTVLVVVEMTGGNDGLNTVIPYADDLYHKARPTLRHTKETVV